TTSRRRSTSPSERNAFNTCAAWTSDLTTYRDLPACSMRNPVSQYITNGPGNLDRFLLQQSLETAYDMSNDISCDQAGVAGRHPTRGWPPSDWAAGFDSSNSANCGWRFSRYWRKRRGTAINS